MRKSLSLVMAAAMAISMLSGCSGQSNTAPAETSATETAAAESSAAEAAGTTAAKAESEAAGTTAAAETSASGASESDGKSAETAALRVGSLKGPTTMGLVSLMTKSENRECKGNYTFTMVTDASELAAGMTAGDLDIVLVPANMASILYQKTGKGVSVLNINTLGVLYVVTADDSIKSISDLSGRTVCMTGKGTTPDYVFQYLLSANGLDTDDVTIEYKSEAAEVAAILKEQPDAIGLLPQPFVTVAMAQNENLKIVLDLTAEWDKVNEDKKDGGSLVTGVTVARNELLADEVSAGAVALFMEEHAESTAFANENVEETAEQVAHFGIIEKAPVAQKALPYCSITCVTGDEMKQMLSGYLNVLYSQDPASVGGQLPDDAFYYIPLKALSSGHADGKLACKATWTFDGQGGMSKKAARP